MAKPILGVFVGDLHVGSDTALCKPQFPIGSKHKRPYQPSANQQWLYECWQNFYKQIKVEARDKLLFVGLGGDLVDGVMHHNSTQTWGVSNDQRNMAIELLRPLVGLSDWCYGIGGTAAHVGDMGDDDQAVYDALRVEADVTWRLNIGKRQLWWAHHGIPVGLRNHTLENGAAILLRDIEARCLAEGARKPDAIIGHDRHRVFQPVTMRGITIAVCPCWQASTYYGARWPFSDTDIGGLLWDVESNAMRMITYAVKDKAHTVGKSLN